MFNDNDQGNFYIRKIPKQYILLVDDQELVLDPLSALLELDGHRVLSFKNSAEAASLIDHRNAHKIGLTAIISDLKMPNFSGIDLLQLSRKNALNLPFFLMSGNLRKSDHDKALILGAAGFLRKPFTLQDFYNTFNSVKRKYAVSA
jgi:DNA-binding NtrC family response regulator